jgi:hypothetical protein
MFTDNMGEVRLVGKSKGGGDVGKARVASFQRVECSGYPKSIAVLGK